MKLTRKNVLEIYSTIEEVSKNKKEKLPTNFIFKILKLKNKLDPVVNAYRETFSPEEEVLERLKEFDQKQIDIVKKYSEKNEDGEVKADSSGNIKILKENRELLNDEIKVIKKEYENELSIIDDIKKEESIFLKEEEEDLDFEKIFSIEDFPKEIETDLLEKLFVLVDY